MILTKGTIHYNFWKFIYGKERFWNYEPSNNFCAYFWQLLIGIITIPLTWIGAIIGKITDSPNGYWINILITLIPYLVIIFLFTVERLIYSEPKQVIIVVGCLISSGLLAVSLKWFILDYLPDSKMTNNINETFGVVKSGFKSFKEANCPIITWNEPSNYEKEMQEKA